jgi:hypothetical protein
MSLLWILASSIILAVDFGVLYHHDDEGHGVVYAAVVPESVMLVA